MKKRKSKSEAEVMAIKEEQRWRIESDLRAIQNAESIRKDKARMSAVQRLAREQMTAVADLAGMKGKPMEKSTSTKAMGTKPMSTKDMSMKGMPKTKGKK